MFGNLKPSWKHLKSEHVNAPIVDAMCRTCASLKRTAGQADRVFLNNDTIFLSLLSPDPGADAAKLKARPFRCINNAGAWNPQKAEFLSDFTAYATMVKCHDAVRDGDTRVPRSLIRYIIKEGERAHTRLKRNHGDFADLEMSIGEYDEIERSRSRGSFDEIAQPCADAYRMFFKWFGETVGSDKPEAFGSIGADYGKAVLLLDAIADYYEDMNKNRFNVVAHSTDFGVASTTPLPHAKEKLWSILTLVKHKARQLSNSAGNYVDAVILRLKERDCETTNTNLLGILRSPASIVSVGAYCPCFTYDACTGDVNGLTPLGVIVILVCGIFVCSKTCDDFS